MYLYIATIALIVYMGKVFNFNKRLFAYLFTQQEEKYDKLVSKIKEEHFKILKTFKSSNAELQKQGVFKLLEIGAGSCANFPYYPKHAQVIATDPNPYFGSAQDKCKRQYPYLQVVKTLTAYAEDLSMVEDNSVDVVVSTLVLCSVEDVGKSLKEIRRILIPGGVFLYWEHCAAVQGTWLRSIQNMLTNFWPNIMDGCHLNRTVVDDIKESGFSDVGTSYFNVPLGNNWSRYIMKIAERHVRGVATK